VVAVALLKPPEYLGRQDMSLDDGSLAAETAVWQMIPARTEGGPPCGAEVFCTHAGSPLEAQPIVRLRQTGEVR